MIIGFQAVLFARRRLARWLPSTVGGKGAASIAPAFYRRFERLLSRLGLRRNQGQTANELASAAARRLAAGNGHAAAGLPAEVVAAYYRVRFGGQRLDKTEAEAIEQSLAVLGTSVIQAQKQ
jgi:hypothetical protein